MFETVWSPGDPLPQAPAGGDYPLPRLGVGLVIWRGDSLLLGLRTGAHGAGEWSFPGGKVDEGEHPLMTAWREGVEETGMKLHRFRALPWWSPDYFPQEQLYFLTLYVECEWLEGEAKILEPHKCLEWRWVKRDREPPRPLFPGVEQAWQRLANRPALTPAKTKPGGSEPPGL